MGIERVMVPQSKIEQFEASTTPVLRVYLLGSPRIEWAGQPLSIPRRQVRALLYRLVTRLQPISREHFCFLFWPDAPEATARRNLSLNFAY